MFERHVEKKEKPNTSNTKDLLNENNTQQQDISQSKQTTKVKKIIKKKVIKEGDTRNSLLQKRSVLVKEYKKIPHTGDTESLDRCE